MSRQTVQTRIRLLLEEQSDQCLHCLSLHLRILSLSEFLDMLNDHVAGQVKIVGDKLICFCLQVAPRTS